MGQNATEMRACIALVGQSGVYCGYRAATCGRLLEGADSMGESDEAAAWLTVSQVAALMQTTARTVTRLLHAGTLPGVYLGTREGWRIRRADVDALVSARYQKGQEQARG